MNSMIRAYVGVIVMTGLAGVSMAGPRDAEWKQVDEAVEQGLPKTAIERLAPIIDGALRDKAYAEWAKAVTRRIVLEGEIEGDRPDERIRRLQAQIPQSPAEVRPLLEALLGIWFWQYFEQNQWLSLERTEIAGDAGDDFQTWSLKRLFAEIDRRFTAALNDAPRLKATPVSTLGDFLVAGVFPDRYRPTLYDFLAYEALEFYSTGEQAGVKAEDTFVLDASSPALGSLDEFLAWKIETTDESSPTVRGLRLLQGLLEFHRRDEDPTALADADLQRIRFAWNKAIGEEKDARYEALLRRFAERWGDHEVSARARHYWAEWLQQSDKLAAAREVALVGARAFPNSVGGKGCANLVRVIESKSLQVSIERVWNAPWPTIDVGYANTTEVHLRAYALDWEKRLTAERHRPEWLSEPEVQSLLRQPAAKSWTVKLPPTTDYRQRIERVACPQDLASGFYLLVASMKEDFSDQDNLISQNSFWVSKLAIVMRRDWQRGRLEGFVLDALTGEPLQGARIRVWNRNPQGDQILPGTPTQTDGNGLFRVPNRPENTYLLLAEHRGERLATHEDLYGGASQKEADATEGTVFFTDRAIYRPGQTIQFKGICVASDPGTRKYEVLKQRTVQVVLADAQGEEVERKTLRSNDYGSFSGSFTAPRGRLLGEMMLRVDGTPMGVTFFRVEEYKRPKFEVKLEAPQKPTKLGEKVRLEGKAIAFTGAAVDGARLKWRVERMVRFPPWWSWWRSLPHGGAQEIARGTAETTVDGRFSLEFVAQPDRSVAEVDEPIFHYEVHVDVTDGAGETQSAERNVAVGYTSFGADITADDWKTVDQPITLQLRTRTHDDQPHRAEGRLVIHRVREPERVMRPRLSSLMITPLSRDGRLDAAGAEPAFDPDDVSRWPEGEIVYDEAVDTDVKGEATKAVKLGVGLYRASFVSRDPFGKRVTAKHSLQVLDPAATKLGIKLPHVTTVQRDSLEPGETLRLLWGSGYDKARAYIELESDGEVLQAFWTPADRTQAVVEQKITEAMRGGVTARVTMVRENREFLTNHLISVPWSNKQLKIKWEHMVSKIAPGNKETWTAVISGPDAQRAVAEMVATLYDQSLDTFVPHQFPTALGQLRGEQLLVQSSFENKSSLLHLLVQSNGVAVEAVDARYRSFPAPLADDLWGPRYATMQGFGGMGGMGGGFALRGGRGVAYSQFGEGGIAPMAAPASDTAASIKVLEDMAPANSAGGNNREGASGRGPALGLIAPRRTLQETAFFFPHLMAEADGTVRMTFTAPETLTRWRFLGFAHDRELRVGALEGESVSAKELMVQPNPPRFLREGDQLELTVKVANQSPTRQQGKVQLNLSDARTNVAVDEAFGNQTKELDWDIPAAESRTFSWRLTVPDGQGPILYKVVGGTERLSDGEEGFLPVLSRRVLVTESLPLAVRGQGTKRFEFKKLKQSADSATLRHENLTVQMASNPSWYAVLALPYLMEYPHECSEQTFNRLYANSLARHIANSDPRIRRVFEQWRGTEALDSPLDKNQDLKTVMLEETPWLRSGKSESAARRDIAILFDANRLNDETARALLKLEQMQRADGAWPWFPGGPANDYMTLYITTGFGRLRRLGSDIDVVPAVRSLARLDAWLVEQHRRIVREKQLDKNHLSPMIAMFLYGRSFFLEDAVLEGEAREASDYFLKQAKMHWKSLGQRQSQAQLALACQRMGNLETAAAILKSLKERSVSDEELGRFWRDTEVSWWWYEAPIETQALMIEAFDEVAKDAVAVEECKTWLLKQKQTQHWPTTKATADAVYSLLLRGTDGLASTEIVEVSLGGDVVKPEKIEAGTGFYEQRFVRKEIQPRWGDVTVKKADPGIAWGGVHWQYLEDVSKVTPHEGTPLKLRKSLYVKSHTAQGPKLTPVNGPVAVGDELVVRIELRVDRDMEYVHLKDHRGSGVEPSNVLSQYKYAEGLGYYESTRDTASHFFLPYLPKGTYVFEYSTRVVHRGKYPSGMASIECMYAPEFNSHSASVMLEVK